MTTPTPEPGRSAEGGTAWRSGPEVDHPFLAATPGGCGATSRAGGAPTRTGRHVTESAVGGAVVSADEDRELAALRAGEEAAFLALVNRHHRAMVHVASLYVKTIASAEEVAQETWVAVLRGLHLFERRSSLKAWIFGILVNSAKARGARDRRSVPLSSLEAEPGEEEPSVSPDRFLDQGHRWAGHWAEPPEPWPDARVESREMIALVREALASLPEAQRTVMSLRDVDGWESSEVCELLGISEGNQRVLLHRARSKVRAHLERRLAGEERA
jgi:RNA polymerase sigma-70 factor, ECF subfamily